MAFDELYPAKPSRLWRSPTTFNQKLVISNTSSNLVKGGLKFNSTKLCIGTLLYPDSDSSQIKDSAFSHAQQPEIDLTKNRGLACEYWLTS
mmetsp:Transcript_147378/g.268615  ORF Transcript_147378/g.268615 Transcript_147378/m.268615 type:complete len:91 (-) Transcript_147378:526-798(-)